MKQNKLLFSLAVFAASLAAVLTLGKGNAFAATKTWDGSAGDNKFSTGANWSGDSAPANGDVLVFPGSAAPTDYNTDIQNDISNLSVAGITFTGTCESYGYYNFTGPLTITGNIDTSATTASCLSFAQFKGAITLSGSNISVIGGGNMYQVQFSGGLAIGTTNLSGTMGIDIDISGGLTGSGAISNTGGGLTIPATESSYSGDVSVVNGVFYSYNGGGTVITTSSNPISISDGSRLVLWSAQSDYTITNSFVIGGGNTPDVGDIYFGGGQGGCPSPIGNITLSGQVTLGGDLHVRGSCGAGLTISNPNLNGHTFNFASGQNATFTYGSTTVQPTYQDTTLSDEQPGQSVVIGAYQRYFIDGVRGDVTVGSKGILAGTGRVDNVTVMSGGIVAPGHSPGTLTTGNIEWVEGGIYEFEIGAEGADQIIANGTVTLGNGTLNVLRYQDYAPKAGDVYTIIANDGSDAVSGTFKDLPEGATFTTGDGAVYRVNYGGGDGNDVTLTVITAPKVPNTGFNMLKNNPILTLSITTGAAVLIAAIARKRALNRA